MVTSRFNKRFDKQNIKISNESSSGFTDVFDEEHSMNKNPTKPYFEFMRDHEVDFMKGEVRRKK